MFLKIDNWLFDKVFQRFADWFTNQTGRGPFWLSATCIHLYISLVITRIVILRPVGIQFVSALFEIAVCIYLFMMSRKIDKRDKISKSPTLNIRRYGPEFRRVRLLAIVIVLFLFVPISTTSVEWMWLVYVGQMSAFISTLYFGSCNTKPPAPPKKNETKLAHAKS